MFSLYKKEVQCYFYSPFAYVVCALFMLIFSLALTNGISGMNSNTLKFSFPEIFYNNFFYFIFLIPALTMRTFAEERKGGTEVLLMSSPLRVTSIVLAKFLAVTTVFLLMLVCSLFYPLVAFLSGGVIWSTLISGYLGFFLWGMLCISIGVFISSLTDNPIIAAVLGEGAMIILLFVDNIIDSELVQSTEWLRNTMNWLSTQQRFIPFSQGLFRIQDLVFFLTITVMFLAWTVIATEKRRWSRG